MTTVNYVVFRRFKYREIFEIRKISEMLNCRLSKKFLWKGSRGAV